MSDVKKSSGLERPAVKFLDWGIAISVLGYGIYANSLIWGGIGMAGVVCAWLKPGSKIINYVGSLKKKPG